MGENEVCRTKITIRFRIVDSRGNVLWEDEEEKVDINLDLNRDGDKG